MTIHHKLGGKLTADCCIKEFLPATISFLIFPTISRLKGKKKTGVGWCLNNNQSFISVFDLFRDKLRKCIFHIIPIVLLSQNWKCEFNNIDNKGNRSSLLSFYVFNCNIIIWGYLYFMRTLLRTT